MLEEGRYRQMVKEAQEKILRAFDAVDPDVAEAELNLGALTIVARGKKIIVSPQPPVRQVWLAAASQGIALHFSWDEATQRWMDDKGQGRELFAFTREVIEKACGVTLQF